MNVPLNIDWQQILLHLLNFVILFAILYFLLYEPVKKFMDKRTQYYKDIDDEAKKKLQQAEDMKQAYSDKLASADKEIEEKRQAAYKSLSEETSKAMRQAKREAEEIVSSAYKKAEGERNKILENAQNEIADMVTDAAEKLVLNSTTSEAYDNFLNTVKGSDADE